MRGWRLGFVVTLILVASLAPRAEAQFAAFTQTETFSNLTFGESTTRGWSFTVSTPLIVQQLRRVDRQRGMAPAHQAQLKRHEPVTRRAHAAQHHTPIAAARETAGDRGERIAHAEPPQRLLESAWLVEDVAEIAARDDLQGAGHRLFYHQQTALFSVRQQSSVSTFTRALTLFDCRNQLVRCRLAAPVVIQTPL